MSGVTAISLLSVGISVLALTVSVATMYFTWLKRGHLKMTKPTLVFFGYDPQPKPTPKVFLRTLLYSTAARGKVIESLYAKVHVEGTSQTFGIWGHGATTVEAQGSGLYVGQEGIALNHHLVLSADQSFEFLPGDHEIEIFARLVGKKRPLLLEKLNLILSDELAIGMSEERGVLFELHPETQIYIGRLQKRRDTESGNSAP